ncbi:MAG: amino acid transporter substrate-binding protein [Betaproteobacteria bacterium]|jgi:polar amino acid transport system substrate-binding protein|nr:amino acid transporter substrate-binding protein [Betaproteobacteria bacterium]
MTASTATPQIPPAAKAELTSTGKLRAGINFQNVLLTTLGPNGEQGGVAVEFARELARRLAVPLDIIPFKSAGALADSVSTGVWDISVLGDEPERAKVIAFAAPLTEIEATYLVPAGSPIRSISEVDRAGIRIVSPAKSAFDLYLSRTIKNAQLVQIAGTKAAQEHFVKEKLDALAGLKPGLLEAAPALPGSRILDGNFTVVRHTVGMPRGRDAAAAYLCDLVEDVKASGLVAKWIEKSGVKGLSVAPPAKK